MSQFLKGRSRDRSNGAPNFGHSNKLPPLVIGLALAEPLFCRNRVMHSEQNSVAASTADFSVPISNSTAALLSEWFPNPPEERGAEPQNVAGPCSVFHSYTRGLVGLAEK